MSEQVSERERERVKAFRCLIISNCKAINNQTEIPIKSRDSFCLSCPTSRERKREVGERVNVRSC